MLNITKKKCDLQSANPAQISNLCLWQAGTDVEAYTEPCKPDRNTQNSRATRCAPGAARWEELRDFFPLVS